MADTIFQVTNAVALLSWVLLILFPYKFWSKKLLFTLVVMGFALVYLFLAAKAFNADTFQSFNTLEGVMGLFTNPLAVVIGWVHYLAFDLMVGMYIAKDAEKHMINRFVIIPCFLFTFMLGPVGLLLYYLIRSAHTKALVQAF